MSTSAVQPASESKTTSRKRRKVSDLALAELSIIYDHLQKLRTNSLDDNDLPGISDDLDEVLAKIEKKLNVPKVVPALSPFLIFSHLLDSTPPSPASTNVY